MSTYAVKCETATTFYVYVEAETSWEAEAKADHELAYNPTNWGESSKPAHRRHIKDHPIRTIRATEIAGEDDVDVDQILRERLYGDSTEDAA